MTGRIRGPASQTDPRARRLGVLLSAFLWLTATVLPAAQPIGHLGQKIQDHVTLRIIGTTDDCADLNAYEIEQNGKRSVFQMSARWLVVTDVRWWASRDIHFEEGVLQPGDLLTFNLFVPSGDDVSFTSDIVLTAANFNQRFERLETAHSEHLTAGFVVSGIPCAAFGSSTSSGSRTHKFLFDVMLHGYLIDRPIARK